MTLGARDRHAALFAADRRLQARMAATAVLTPLSVVAALVGLAFVLEREVLLAVLLALAIGVVAAVRARRRQETAHVLTVAEAPELHAVVERLCVRADLPKPEIVVDAERQPNSWILDLPGRPPRLHLTQGLLDVLDPGELEAVIAHELCHVAHGDATVMTVVGLPGAALKDGAARITYWPLTLGALVAYALGTTASLGTNALARSRELAADAGAAALTGRPSALASALMKLSGSVPRVPQEDLRIAAARNAFNLLPVHDRDEAGWRRDLRGLPVVRGLTATHPSVERRIAALRAAEERLQGQR